MSRLTRTKREDKKEVIKMTIKNLITIEELKIINAGLILFFITAFILRVL